ncbi:hypothetical protein Tco_1414439, partial [Tanacetum coccineum]
SISKGTCCGGRGGQFRAHVAPYAMMIYTSKNVNIQSDPTAYVRPVAHAIASYMVETGVRVLRNVKRKLQEKKTDASVPSAELAKEVVDTVSSPKFDFATDLFDILSMGNGPTDKVLVAASYADALWVGFQ